MIDSMQEDLGGTTPFMPSSLPLRNGRTNRVPAANLTYAYAGFGAVLGILFGVAAAATLHQAPQTAAVKTIMEPAMVIAENAGIVHAGFALPEEKDMGSVTSLTSGLRGHLTTSWSEKLNYHFVVGPTEPSQNEAFAQTVNNPPRPISMNLQLKAAAGQVLCSEQVVLKPAGQKQAAQLDHDGSSAFFQNDLGKDGKIESISSQGTMPCTKQAYDSAAFWSFAPQFPNLREQAKLVKHSAIEPVVAKIAAPEVRPAHKLIASVELPKAIKLPVVQAAPKATTVAQAIRAVRPVAKPVAKPVVAAPVMAIDVPETTKPAEVATEAPRPAAFHFEIEGDDEIVDFDAAQKSLETSEGKTFYVNETLIASNVAGWLDEQTNIHYRCDETSTCTLSLASAPTVLHATMRSHHSFVVQSQTLSSDATPNSSDAAPNPIPVSPGTQLAFDGMGR